MPMLKIYFNLSKMQIPPKEQNKAWSGSIENHFCIQHSLDKSRFLFRNLLIFPSFFILVKQFIMILITHAYWNMCKLNSRKKKSTRIFKWKHFDPLYFEFKIRCALIWMKWKKTSEIHRALLFLLILVCFIAQTISFYTYFIWVIYIQHNELTGQNLLSMTQRNPLICTSILFKA